MRQRWGEVKGPMRVARERGPGRLRLSFQSGGKEFQPVRVHADEFAAFNYGLRVSIPFTSRVDVDATACQVGHT
jgi:hypothetical protein